MNKRCLLFIVVLLSLVNFVSASCNLDVKLINQDPYPAIPGEYVKVVFQINGVDNPDCDGVSLKFMESFPFYLDPDTDAVTKIYGGTYELRYSSYLLAPYNVRVDENALDGENPIDLEFSSNQNSEFGYIKRFNITVEDVKTDFEIFVEDYDSKSEILTFEILNVGENNVEALTVEIPKQENIIVKGNNVEIVGSLDSNEDTTFSYEAKPKDGEIKLNINYNDKIDVRRTLEKTVNFDLSYFKDRKRDEKQTSYWVYIFGVVLILVIIWLIRKSNSKKKKR
jgi:hypothetical protein